MATTIRDIYLQFDPLEPLPARDPRYVDCLRERGLRALYERISLPLSDSPRPILFSGHIGDGKTTILNQFIGRLGQEENDFVAYGEASERLDLGDVEYDDVLLAILAVVNEALRERYRNTMAQNPFQNA